MKQGSDGACTCDRQPRAVDACSVHAHALPESRAEHPRRTAESVRAETAYRDWAETPPSERPLAAQRLVLAKVLFHVLKKHGVSRLRFADMIGVNEKQVRKMLSGLSPIPMAALGVMPLDMTLDFMDGVVGARSGEPAPPVMKRAIDDLRRSRDLPAVYAAQSDLIALARELSR